MAESRSMAYEDAILGLSGSLREDAVHELRRLFVECSDSKGWEVSCIIAWVLLGIIFSVACLRLGCFIASWYLRPPGADFDKVVVPDEEFAAIPPPPPPPRPPPRTVTTLSTAAAQTEPQVTVELERGAQRPLDLVCCVDSSVSVGEADLLKSVAFLRLMAAKLEMPAVQMGVIRFHHDFRVISAVTGDASALLRRLEGMGFEPGETKMASPLRHAGMMLRCGVQDACDSGRRKAVLVITDGDPNDLQEAEQEAEILKSQGVLLVFVQIGELVQPHVIRRLASPSAAGRKHIIELRSYDDLAGAVAEVLHSLVEVSLWVRRAKANIDLKRYSEVPDVSKNPGEEVLVPGWERNSEECWCWEPQAGRCLEAARCERWDAVYEERKLPLLQSASATMSPQLGVTLAQTPFLKRPAGANVNDDFAGHCRLPAIQSVPRMQSPAVQGPVHLHVDADTHNPPTERNIAEMRCSGESICRSMEPQSSVPEQQKSRRSQATAATQTEVKLQSEVWTQTVSQPGLACGSQTLEQPRAVASTQTEPLPEERGTDAEERLTMTPRCTAAKPVKKYVQTEPPACEGMATQTDETPREMPIVRACLAPWRHAPLDLVICVDSSASFCLARQPLPGGPPGRSQFVETGAFENAKSFVGRLAQAVQMPEVQLALLRFEDVEETICPLTNELESFLDKLFAMEPSIGETKFAPPMRRALDMLSNHGSRRSGWAADMQVDGAVLVITDGDPNDSVEAQDAAKKLSERGIQLLFVKVGGKGSHAELHHLASPKTLPPPASLVEQRELPAGSVPRPCGVFAAVPGTRDVLHALVPDVLRQLLRVTRYISRARFNLPLRPYQEVTADELDATPGAEVTLCNNRPLIDTTPVMWDACELDEALAELPKLVWARDHHGTVTSSVPNEEALPGSQQQRPLALATMPPEESKSRSAKSRSAKEILLQKHQDGAVQSSEARTAPQEILLQKHQDGAVQPSEAHTAPQVEQHMSPFQEAEAALQGLSAQISKVRAHKMA